MSFCSFLAVLVVSLSFAHCALNQEADQAIKRAIRSAVRQGLDTIDGQLRKKYWQYLQKSQLIHYNTQVLPQSLNYKLIYLHQNNIFRVNCDIDKVQWKVYVNSLVRLPSNLVSRIYDKNYAELFLLDKEVVIVDHPKEYSQKNERKKNNGKKQGKGKGSRTDDEEKSKQTEEKPVKQKNKQKNTGFFTQKTRLSQLTTQP